MKTKLIFASIAILTSMSVWADDVWNYNVYDDCNKNGYTGGNYTSAPADVQAVDLGLPSGIKWASCNVGADTPEGYGYYYAWGEVVPKEKYNFGTYKYANNKNDYEDIKLTKYCNNADYGDNGFTDNKIILDPEDDAAYLNWGSNWRMPNDAEWTELLDNCTLTWTIQNGVNGCLVTSNTNGNSIFLPATGCRYDYVLHATGTMGLYFSSSLCTDAPACALSCYFDSTGVYRDSDRRRTGRSIRPVYSSNQTISYLTVTLFSNGCENANVIGCDTGQQVNVTAVPKDWNRHFVRWSDGNTDNPRLVTVTQDTVLTAEFADDPILIVVSSNYSRGYVYGDGQFKPNTSVEISAYPNVGYHFTQWSDSNTDNPRTIVLTCDTTFTAEFAQTFSGQCGDNLSWKYAGHTLTISGTGAMYDYSGNNMPWLLFRDTTDAVVLEQDITHIGNNAFNGFARLNKIELPSTLTSIGASAFAGCRKLYDIYSYAVEPPVADNSSFANYNVYLHVPCDNLRDYQLDAVFGSFKYIQCLGAENTTTDEDVTVTPSDNEAVFVWRADGSADSYTLEIRKDGEVFCTLVFNASGQLSSIAFAPSRNGQAHHTAEQTGAGFRFTVTGLSESTRYTFGMTIKDANNATLQTYTGEFQTTGTATALDNAATEPTTQKIVRNGQVLILRGDKTYTTMGVEVNK